MAGRAPVRATFAVLDLTGVLVALAAPGVAVGAGGGLGGVVVLAGAGAASALRVVRAVLVLGALLGVRGGAPPW